MKKFGIDISHWQGNFDFNKAIKEGVEFVIIKGGGGDDGLYTDSKFNRNYNEAKAKGLPVGAYWFSKALTVAESEREAEYFYNNVIKGKQFELPVYMDVEHAAMLKLGRRTLTNIVKAFCEKMEAFGCWVGIYSTPYAFRAYMIDEELTKYAHWVAQWAKECTYSHTECLGMWQFGGETNLIRSNKIAGVTCDQNYMLVDYPALIKAAGLNGFAKTATEQAKPANNINVGDKVKISTDATVYGTNNKFAPFVYETTLYVRDIDGDRVVISTQPTGAVTGAVHKKFINAKTAIEQAMPANNIGVGDKVKISTDATVFGTSNKFAPFVYKTTLYVRDIDGDRVVISTQPTGAVTGAVHKKFIKKG